MKYRRMSRIWSILIAAVFLAVVTGGILYGRYAAETAEERRAYTELVNAYNVSVGEYRQLLEITSIENITGLPELPEVRIMDETLKREDVRRETQLIQREWAEMRYVLGIVRAITEPSSEWVMERLRRVEGILEIAAVTEERDPNGQLGKDGGYTACVYFTFDGIPQDTISGGDAIGKGTDGGGAVEVYRTKADALARCEYLAQFDNTLLYTGSCAVVGTMVIRTSYALSDEEQWLLTDRITQVFTG